MKTRANAFHNRQAINELEARIIDLEDRVRRLEGTDDGYTVKRGARGKWFVYFEGVSTGDKGHESREEAEAAAEELNKMVIDMRVPADA